MRTDTETVTAPLQPPQPLPPGTPYPPRPPFNTYAIIAIIMACFVLPPLGIYFGHLAKRQIKRTGEAGDQLATWGLVLSYAFTVIGVLACCGWLAVVVWAGFIVVPIAVMFGILD